jgi:CCR4-NOT transcriptional regulation complex NOT5 subunit
MVGGGLRSVRSLYQRARSRLPAPSDAVEGSSERRGRRSRGTTQVPPQEAQEEQVAPQDDTEEEAQEEDEEAHQTASCSAASSSSSVYLRGPATLPKRPIPLERRPVIRPDGER